MYDLSSISLFPLIHLYRILQKVLVCGRLEVKTNKQTMTTWSVFTDGLGSTAPDPLCLPALG